MHANHVTTQMTNDFLCSFLQQGKQRASLKDTSDDVIVYSDCVYTFCNSQKNFAHPPNPAYLLTSIFLFVGEAVVVGG